MRPSPLGPDDSEGGERESTLAAGVGASSVVPIGTELGGR